jgi:S-DNA-T family DNA segregation ATPase FtsK/SpoIIIE
LRAAEFLGSGIHVLTSDACLPTALPELGIGTGPSLLVIDDAELLMDSPVSSVLDDILRRADDTGTLVLAAGAADVLATSYRPWVIELRRSRTGVLLSPLTPMDGHVLGVTLPRSAVGEMTPGRGLLVRAGTSTPMQVALPEARPCDGEGQAVR